MLNNFEPVLNNFDLSVDSPVGSPASPCDSLALSGHFDLVGKAVERMDRSEQLGRALSEYSLGNFEFAFNAFTRLWQRGIKAQDTELAECACNNLASACRDSGDWQNARIWQQQSIAWRERQEPHRRSDDDSFARLACDLTGRGADEFINGDFELAESFWSRALAIEEWRGNLEGQATDCGNLGLLAAVRGNLSTGIRWLRKAHRLHRLMFDLVGSGKDLLNLAELFRLQGAFRRSTACARRAVRCFERSGAKSFRELARQRLREALRTEAVFSFDATLN